MEKLDSLVDVKEKVFGRKGGYTADHGQNFVNFIFKDNVYKLTDEEVEWLETMKKAKNPKPNGIIHLPETMMQDLELLKNQKSVLDILKDCLEHLKEQPKKDISEIISITDRIIDIFKLAQNKK